MVDKLLCDGIVLASGYREILNQPGDVDGLLFGDIQCRTVNVISDMQGEYSKIEATAVLHHVHVACSAWYHPNGKICGETLASIVASRAPMRLIGWFSSRLNSPFRASIREIAVHANLQEWKKSGATSTEAEAPLIFALFSGSSSDSGHIITQDLRAFVATTNLELEAVPVSFRNLGASSQFEFAAFEPSSYTELPGLSHGLQTEQEPHPLEECAAAAIAQVEADAEATSQMLQQVSVEQAELASLQAELQEHRTLLNGD